MNPKMLTSLPIWIILQVFVSEETSLNVFPDSPKFFNHFCPVQCIPFHHCVESLGIHQMRNPKICYRKEQGNLFVCCQRIRKSISVDQTKPSGKTKHRGKKNQSKRPTEKLRKLENKMSKTPSDCGKADEKLLIDFRNSLRITGGVKANSGAWPWMVSIHTRRNGVERFVCGGTIISNNHILTAGHCFKRNGGKVPTDNYVIRMGSSIYNRGTEDTLREINVHPKYKLAEHYNDIAVLKTKKSINFSKLIRRLCLPSESEAKQNINGKEVTVIGWGDQSYGGRRSSELREVTVNIVSRKRCNDSYSKLRSSSVPRGITYQFVCAGVPSGGKDACQSDSGGPLMLSSNGRWAIVGIVSFGYACAQPGYPGVYTKVGSYLNWIKSKIG